MKSTLFKNHIYLIIAGFLLIFVFNTITIAPIFARPGGGHSYSNDSNSSSSSSSSSSSGSSTDSDYSYDSNSNTGSSSGRSCPICFFAFAGLVIVLVVLKKIKEKKDKLKRIASMPTRCNFQKKTEIIENKLAILKKSDPNFSKTLFLDFVTSIFTKYYAWLDKEEFKNLYPFLSKSEIKIANNSKIKKHVSNIVIGSINITEIEIEEGVQSITVIIDANYTLKQKDLKTRYIVTEKWVFDRNAELLSPEPKKMRELSCPQCGAGLDFSDSGICKSCETLIKSGEMQWYVYFRKIQHQEHLTAYGLTYYAEETGTKWETLFQKNLNVHTARFAEEHKINWLEWETNFKIKVVSEYFKNLYTAWSLTKLDNVRNLLTDRLYESWMFWIDSYKNNGLTNKLDKVSIKKIEFVKLEIDKFYEAVTVRIHASCKDYVLDKQGRLMGGSKIKKRKFTEYWTFIRRAGVKNDDYDYKTCPNCGAPADKIGQAGICEYCNTKISNGDFSWVLSIISQDEVYKG